MAWNDAIKSSGAYRSIKGAEWPGEIQDYLLDKMGLERKATGRAVLTGVGFFALGILVGSALGLMFAPMAGAEMRTTIKERGVRGVVDRARAPATAPSA